MRRYLKRNYWGSYYLNEAADSKERFHLKSSEDSLSHAIDSETLNTSFLSTFNLMVEAISIKNNVDDDGDDNDSDDKEQLSAYNINHSMVDRPRLSLSAEPMDSRSSGASSDQNLVHATLRISPGLVPSEADERIVFELPSSMVRPLKVVSGNFQVSKD